MRWKINIAKRQRKAVDFLFIWTVDLDLDGMFTINEVFETIPYRHSYLANFLLPDQVVWHFESSVGCGSQLASNNGNHGGKKLS